MIIHAGEAYRRGIRGKGIGVAVLDTGIYRHPDFGGRILQFKDILRGMQDCYDDCSHGTHVSGILGGSGLSSNGVYMGVAPECSIIHVKVLDIVVDFLDRKSTTTTIVVYNHSDTIHILIPFFYYYMYSHLFTPHMI